MSDEFDVVLEQVRERVEPDDEERAALQAATDTLVERTEDALEDLPVDGEVLLVGSAARETWLAGDRDIDIFVSFPPDLEREQLRSYGLEVGHTVLPDGTEEFAEHPYVVGEYEGFDVDIVPCYAVESASDIKSAVDRTPFHARYVTDRLTPDLASDVRVTKQFLTGIGIYGSNLKTRGFSGFLTELLVLEYGGFRELVTAAADWDLPVRLDPEGHGTTTFEDDLVVIDPTDPERNVAAVLSTANLGRFIHFARDILDQPRLDLFETPDRDPLDADTVRERFRERNTTPVALTFDAPDIVDDQLWPQLDRSLSGIADELQRRGFDIFRTDRFVSDGEAMLLFELAVAQRPALERHTGPPVHVRIHAESFYEAYADGDATGPFIYEDRYVVERPREFTTAREFLESDKLFDVALGANVESALETGYTLAIGDDIATLADTFGEQFVRYLSPTPRRN